MAELESIPNVRLMPRTTALGTFGHEIYGAVERVADHLATPHPEAPRQILWRINAAQTLLCAGATERPIAFDNNDRPGIMLASALRTYANRYAATAAKHVAVFKNNDDGHRTATDLQAAGVHIFAVVDVRQNAPLSSQYDAPAGAEIVDTRGRLGLKSVTVCPADGTEKENKCGALGVSGGWNPNLQLTSHQRGRPTWDDAVALLGQRARRGLC